MQCEDVLGNLFFVQTFAALMLYMEIYWVLQSYVKSICLYIYSVIAKERVFVKKIEFFQKKEKEKKRVTH
jgi:hypothetical protein